MGVSSHLHFTRTPHAATVAGGDGGCTHSDVCVMMGLRVRQAATNQGTCVEASGLLYPALRWCQVSSQEKVSETELCRPEGQGVHSQESRMGQGEELHCPLMEGQQKPQCAPLGAPDLQSCLALGFCAHALPITRCGLPLGRRCDLGHQPYQTGQSPESGLVSCLWPPTSPAV